MTTVRSPITLAAATLVRGWGTPSPTLCRRPATRPSKMVLSACWPTLGDEERKASAPIPSASDIFRSLSA